MPLPRFATLDPSRRTAILRAAAEEYARVGFEGASYNRIIVAAGVSKGAMYYYFDNKEDLLLTVVADLAERSSAAIGPPGRFVDAAGFWSEMRALNDRAMEFFYGDPVVAGLAKQIVRTSPESSLGRAVVEYTGRLERYTAELLRRGQAVGAVRRDLPLELLAHLVTGLGEAIDRWLLPRWESIDPALATALPVQLFDLFVRLTAPAVPRSPP